MEFGYVHNYEVRYDECNLYGELTPTALLRYLQDIAGLDATRAVMISQGTWVARRTIIEFGFQAVVPRDRLQIHTYPLGFTKVTALRAYDLRLVAQDGSVSTEPVIRARTLWVYLDERGRPARFTLGQYAGWQPPARLPVEPPLPDFPTHPPYRMETTVRFSDLDVMGHVNNTSYVQLLDDAAWQAFTSIGLPADQSQASYPRPRSYDIEYLESARAEDKLVVESWFEPSPANLNGYRRLDRLSRDGKPIVRAASDWFWQGAPALPPALSRLWA